ncbi:MAG TPA: polymer-forming cytoskeletal protein [Terriglobales bacterium]|jgi:cytoskeletal protein CcmA (bactofilin family)
MLQSPERPVGQSSTTSHSPLSAAGAPVEQATIGRSLVIKGELTGAESLYVDGRIEGSITVADHRVTIGRNGIVAANITAREIVIMGKVKGNIQCTDRVDIRSEGSLTGDVITQRISVEDGAILKGSVQVRAVDTKAQANQPKSVESVKSNSGDQSKPVTTAVGA